MIKNTNFSTKKSLLITKNTLLLNKPLIVFFNLELLNFPIFLERTIKINTFFWKYLIKKNFLVKFPLKAISLDFNKLKEIPITNTFVVKYYNIYLFSTIINITQFSIINIIDILTLNQSFFQLTGFFQCFLKKH